MQIIEYFLKRLIRKGHLRLVTSNGRILEFGTPGERPRVTVRMQDKNLLFKLAQDFTLAFGEAYMDQRLTIEEGTLHDALSLFAMNYSDAPLMPWDFFGEIFLPIERFFMYQNSLTSSRKNVAHHYDLSADFFKLFLDSDMQYSCAFFKKPDDDIEAAQMNKKRLIAAKLLLEKGMHVLDVGCGFGGLAIFLAKNYGVRVTGITLSKEQYDIAVKRVREEGLDGIVNIHMRDYREETGTYDRFVSVGMFEHVGLEHYRTFFSQLKAVLKPDGVALLHTIGRMDVPGTPDNWINKYIFPGGYSPALSELSPAIEKHGLWVTDLEIWRMHYAKTLVAWRDAFNQHRETVKQIYDERFCRMWEFFLIAAEMEFRYGRGCVFHVQLAKHVNAVPFTRDYMLTGSAVSLAGISNQN